MVVRRSGGIGLAGSTWSPQKEPPEEQEHENVVELEEWQSHGIFGGYGKCCLHLPKIQVIDQM